ncbi:hypothetical protein [Neobacillus cucumis]|nr:hypothetical protein [Neobacillus cucumis]WHY92967.1 hypothetical protein QNK12_05595 [Neobacillus cucumis]
MKTHKKQDKTLTYESDGKMGNHKKESTNKRRDFFNTTQNSE